MAVRKRTKSIRVAPPNEVGRALPPRAGEPNTTPLLEAQGHENDAFRYEVGVTVDPFASARKGIVGWRRRTNFMALAMTRLGIHPKTHGHKGLKGQVGNRFVGRKAAKGCGFIAPQTTNEQRPVADRKLFGVAKGRATEMRAERSAGLVPQAPHAALFANQLFGSRQGMGSVCAEGGADDKGRERTPRDTERWGLGMCEQLFILYA
ncbi:hypothetical protein EDB87DRAFT_1581653 [Lactarius vividus]|nr:hypothetical protein EDB87DRAFT_1581653 [Lactarius vividus]